MAERRAVCRVPRGLRAVILQLVAASVLAIPGGKGPGTGKHVVLVAAEPEYRCEQALPQLARILATRHGFRCTVVFAQDDKGMFDPAIRNNVPALESLKTADLCILMARFQDWPAAQMDHFVDYHKAGKPIIALRTSTHAFAMDAGSSSPVKDWSWNSKSWPGGFGKQVLGETWVTHWGKHGSEGTRGTPVGNHVVLKGVREIFVTTDLYEAHPPSTVTTLVRGEIVNGLKATDPLANDPKRGPMPAAWIMPGSQKVFTTTMGSSLDLLDDNFRRLLINATFWATGLETSIRDNLDTGLVKPYEPTMWGFGKHPTGKRPAEF